MNFENYVPLGKNLIIEIPDKKTPSGIIMSNTELEEVAIVRAIGDEVEKVTVNDNVIFNQYAGNIILGDKHFRVIEEKDIFVKVKG